MKNLLTICLIIVIGFNTQSVLAQAKATFEKIQHDFGKIKEEEGPADVTFEFTNTGDKALVLTNVKASCGCTTPSWTKDPVQPGAKGTIKASYNPRNRPGKFVKSITVYTNGQPDIVALTIQGEVIPRQKGPEDWYPSLIGNLRMNTRNIYFNRIFNDEKAKKEFVLYNQGGQAINLDLEKSFASLKGFITYKASGTVVNPKDSVNISMEYDASKRNDWGYVSNNFNLITDDINEPVKRIYVSANITENFGDLTDDSKRPNAEFDKKTHDFGKINQNTRNSTTFTLTNGGEAPLIIRKTKASCGCTASQPKKTTLAPGESTQIDVTYASGTKKGKQRQTVTVITNDPSAPVVRLNIEADILSPETDEGSQK